MAETRSSTFSVWRRLLTEAGFDIKAGESPIVPVMLYNAKLAQDSEARAGDKLSA
jgi:glycine C-acetyltransferase